MRGRAEGGAPGKMSTPDSRAAGAMLGLAIGDALGLPVDFGSRAERLADPVTGLRAAAAWGGGPGSWSGETSLALRQAESILASGFDPGDFGQRALAWLDAGGRGAGPIALGGAVGRSLGRIRGGLPAVLSGGRGENDNGNAALVRILPASIWLAAMPDPLRWRALAAFSALTHGHPRCFLAAWIHSLVASGLLGGSSPADAYAAAVDAARAALPQMHHALRAEAEHFGRILGGKLAALPASDLRGSGYVVHNLEAGLWCLLTGADFGACVLSAVNLGENAKASAATAGGLAGLAHGREGLPRDWVAQLDKAEEIEATGLALAALVEAPTPVPGSYRILPGKLFAGPHPLAPQRGVEGDSTETRLSAILDSGIDGILDLTEDGETLGGRAVPQYWKEYETLAARRGMGVERRRLSIADMSTAGGGVIGRALGEIDAMLAAGRRVYVHCLGGTGRTGTIVGAWLIERGLASPSEAIGLLAALRSASGAPDRASPETDGQRAAVIGWRPGPSALTV
ncbi:MAG TPA: ADP-ribosylglycohydrolase family protein [Rectinemataceae bacterium]|nr:ADP-ribosylglycohydrolase family protein [Rectinemataceae bacterium]